MVNIALVCDGKWAASGPLQVSGADAELQVHGSTISRCSSVASGGSIAAYTQAVLLLSETTIEKSHSQGDGGALAIAGALATISRSKFESCSAEGEGGAIAVTELTRFPYATGFPANVSISVVIFSNTSAASGGAVSVTSNSSLMLNGSDFEGCIAAGDASAEEGGGGALSVKRGAKATVTACSFSNNTARVQGGAVEVTSSANVSLSTSVLRGNQALGRGGGALCVRDAHVSLEQNNLRQNLAKAGGGGALFWEGEHVPTIVQSCRAGEELFVGSMPSSCSPCAAGTFKARFGPHNCTLCEKGSYSTASATACMLCGVGKYSDKRGAQAEQACVQCPAGSDAPAGEQCMPLSAWVCRSRRSSDSLCRL